MATLRLEIVTPEAKTYSDDVDMVVLPGIEGELGILPQHVPLMTQLQPGELHVKKGMEDVWLAVGQGFVEIGPDHVSVLTDMAVEEKAIDEAAAQEAIDRAQKAMKEEHLNDEEVAAVEATIQRSLAQLNVKRRRRQG
jgi:F-type H+-transporting ATPase subunit epsilon